MSYTAAQFGEQVAADKRRAMAAPPPVETRVTRRVRHDEPEDPAARAEREEAELLDLSDEKLAAAVDREYTRLAQRKHAVLAAAEEEAERAESSRAAADDEAGRVADDAADALADRPAGVDGADDAAGDGGAGTMLALEAAPPGSPLRRPTSFATDLFREGPADARALHDLGDDVERAGPQRPHSSHGRAAAETDVDLALTRTAAETAAQPPPQQEGIQYVSGAFAKLESEFGF